MITTEQENQVFAVVCAAISACGGDCEVMLAALLGATAVVAGEMADPVGALDGAIAGLEEAQDLFGGGVRRPLLPRPEVLPS